MLIRFNVSNFLSFNETQEFTMIGGKVRSKSEHLSDDNKLKLLRFAAVYGANASGKSNLISALDFARTVILGKIPEGTINKYHKTVSENKNRPSYFEFEVKIGNQYFAYGFEILLSQRSVVDEWLVELSPNGADKELFTRNVKNKTYTIGNTFHDKSLSDRLEFYAQDVKSDDSTLFLTVMNQNKSDLYKDNPQLRVFKDVYDWFRTKLDINYPEAPITNYSYFATRKNTEEISRIISAFGTGISKFRIVEVSPDAALQNIPAPVLKTLKEELEKQNSSHPKHSVVLKGRKEFFLFEIDKNDEVKVKTLEFEHENTDALFRLSEESDGTTRLLDLIEVLLSDNKEKVYIIDEIDRCLHPQLTYRLIETYLKLSKNSQRQLIVTTHESHLLDFDLLRRDEIWFVDKDPRGHSSLYSLEAYNERFDKKIDKAYLEGRYGGVPVFSSVFPIKGE